jgi:MFS family permease
MPNGQRRSTAAFRHRDFTVFWFAALVSNSGTWLQNVTVPFVLFKATHNAAWVGFASFAQFTPGVLLAPLAGSLADRFSRRVVLLVTQSLLGVAALVLWVEWLAGWTTPWTLTITITVSGTIQALSIAAWQAFVTELVPREDLLNAVTLNSAQFNAARAIGPALGGVVLGTLGAGAAFLLNAMSYGAVVLALVLVRVRRAAADTSVRSGILREFAGTIRYVRSRRGIVACCTAIAAVGLLGSPIFSLVIVFADDVFQVSGLQYGLLTACLGLGAVIGAPVIAGHGSALKRSRLAGTSLLVYALSIAAFGASPIYALGAVSLLVAGAAYLGIASTLNTTVQLQVDEAMRGRVIALYLMVFTATIPIGSLVQGWTAEVVGPRQTTVTAGLLLAAVVSALRLAGRWSAIDDAGPAPVMPSPIVDSGEMLAAGVARFDDRTPTTHRTDLDDGGPAASPEFEPAIDGVDDASRG